MDGGRKQRYHKSILEMDLAFENHPNPGAEADNIHMPIIYIFSIKEDLA